MRADNSFAFAFNKIAPPESSSPEALRAYANKVNRAFEEIYEKVYGYVDIKNLSPQARKEIDNKVESKELDKYTLITQTEDMIALEAARVDGNVSALSVRADGIEAVVTSVDNKAGQAQSTASGAASAASAAGAAASEAYALASQVKITAEEIRATVAAIDLDQYPSHEEADAAIQAAIDGLNIGQYTTAEEAIAAVMASIAQNGIAGYSTTSQTAQQISSAVADKASVSYVQQTANSLSSTIASTDGKASEAQNKANEAMSAAELAATAASSAQTAASSANTILSDIASDEKLTASEKQSTQKEWLIIVDEKPKIDAQADLLAVSKTAYGTAYTALSTYITPLLSDLTTTSNIVGDAFRTKFKDYYNARQDILNSISSKNKTLADNAQSTANGASTTASSADGKATQALQTANEFSYKLRDPTYNHEVRIGNHRQGPAIKFYAHGSVDADSSVSADSGYIDVYGAQQADLTGGDTTISAVPGRVMVNNHIAPNAYAHGAASLGTRAEYGEYRFKNVNITGSVNSSSDRRLKRDISDLDTDLLIDLLRSLRPRAFRMIADGEDGKMRWGFVAQEVKEALEALGITSVEFLDDDNPDHLALCYTELVAVLVKGWQEQQRKIDAMEGQIYAFGKRLAALEVTRDDRR